MKNKVLAIGGVFLGMIIAGGFYIPILVKKNKEFEDKMNSEIEKMCNDMAKPSTVLLKDMDEFLQESKKEVEEARQRFEQIRKKES